LHELVSFAKIPIFDLTFIRAAIIIESICIVALLFFAHNTITTFSNADLSFQFVASLTGTLQLLRNKFKLGFKIAEQALFDSLYYTRNFATFDCGASIGDEPSVGTCAVAALMDLIFFLTFSASVFVDAFQTVI